MTDITEICIPITRAFEDKDGKKFIYGYCAIFDSSDNLGTTITRELVQRNIPRLKKYPSLRWMHKEPLGKVVFDVSVNGVSTYTDEHGFHVLCKIFDACQKEFEMIKEGGFGFSYGLLPTRTQDNVFLEGVLYEISVVDSPAHPETEVHVIRSMTQIANAEEPTPLGFRILDHKLETCPNIPHGFSEMVERVKFENPRPPNPNYSIEFNKNRYPDICGENCPNIRHCSAYPRNIGEICINRYDLLLAR